MAVNTELRESLPEGVILFNNPAFDNSIVGLSITTHQAIYDYSKMVQEFISDNGCTEQESIDWIDYNTLGAVSCMSAGHPIVMSTKEYLPL